MRDELLDERANKLFNFVAEISEQFAPESEEEPTTPDFSDLLKRDIRRYLEDEIIPAVSLDSDDWIDKTELRHEVSKKALLGLKLSALRRGAQDVMESPPSRYSAEDLAEVVARSLGWDPDAVAQFVLDHVEEPTPDNSHVSRLYALSPDPGITERIESEISQYMGRYIRVGVAQWYAFTDLKLIDHGIRVYGRYMSYTTDVEQVDSSAKLVPVRSSDEIAVDILPHIRIVEVGNSTIRASRAAVFAATAVFGEHTLDYVPNAGSDASRVRGLVHGSSLFLLNILENRIPNHIVTGINLTVARFKFDNTDVSDSSKPALTAVRFEGTHVLDSVQACRFIVVDGRPLANISFRLSLRRSDSGDQMSKSTSTFPVKIAIERDHVHVTTGLGDDPLRAPEAHALVKRAIQAEIVSGHEPSALEGLISRMAERAQATQPSDRPSMLSTDLRRTDRT
ncbi:MAG TPA: hypothetical protein VGG53_14770 [Mycobacterium sp.]|jgi:hypothetical protein|uniref:hypothetical protein n=1 Tax=Mycobacterium sp. TaxID=1785 RepID=UPI002F3F34CF